MSTITVDQTRESRESRITRYMAAAEEALKRAAASHSNDEAERFTIIADHYIRMADTVGLHL